jgi:hypothetical protein
MTFYSHNHSTRQPGGAGIFPPDVILDTWHGSATLLLRVFGPLIKYVTISPMTTNNYDVYKESSMTMTPARTTTTSTLLPPLPLSILSLHRILK